MKAARRPRLCDDGLVRRFKSMMILATLALAVSLSACKKEEETEKPDDTWTPDESLEPPAPTTSNPEMSEEERLEQAKELYMQAEGKYAEEDWAAAVDLYEQAYNLVPGKHGFALKVGLTAEKAGDCAKAQTFLQHFINYATEDKYADDRKQAEDALGRVRDQGCE